MATLEAIIKGSPAAFEGEVRAFDRRLCDQHGLPMGAMLIYKTHYLPNVPTRWDVTEVIVAVSDLPLAESVHRPIGGFGYDSPVMAWGWPAIITAHSMPGERSGLLLQCEEAILPVVEVHWQALRAELRRLGYIEAGEAEPVVAKPEPVAPKPKRGGGSVPEKLEERARCVFEWEKARRSQPGLSGQSFAASRDDVFASGSTLYVWRRDVEVQAYIERHYRRSAITQQRHSQESKP